MTARQPELQLFLDTLEAALAERVTRTSPAGGAASRIFAALARPGQPSGRAPVRFPVCAHLPAALAEAAKAPPAVARHAAALAALAPDLVWRRRPETEDARFTEGHANATIVGPSGIEERQDVLVGISLMAPDVVYPDHRHPPEEVYLVMSEGAWRQGPGLAAGPWHAPGPGGIVYNPPDIVHAMRSAPATPLLATWCLWAG